MPEVSILIPVYNSALFLRQCIESLVGQTLNNIEIILINDGSPDNSGEICDEYATSDERIIVIHQENLGGAVALNRAINYATAPYVMYLDADDWIEPETCLVAVNALKNENVDIVFWSHYKYKNDKNIEAPYLFKQNRLFDEKDMTFLQRRVVGLYEIELSNPTTTDAMSAVWGRLYRKKVILENKIQWVDAKLVGSSDVLFSLELFHYSKSAFFVNIRLNHYRVNNPFSLTKNYSFSLFNKYINLFNSIDKHIQYNKLDANFKTALNNRISLSLINIILSILASKNSLKYISTHRHLSEILNNEIYDNALKSFDVYYLPYHWKLFYFFAKFKIVTGMIILGKFMQKLRQI